MAFVPARQLTAGLLPLAALAAGCLTPGGSAGEKPPAPGPVCQVAAQWQNKVCFAPDPTRGGVQAPGLAGRVYLFGEQVGYPAVGDGSLVVDLADETSGQPVWLERWEIDPRTLQL